MTFLTTKNEPMIPDTRYYLEGLQPLLLLDELNASGGLLLHVLLLELIHQPCLVEELRIATQHLGGHIKRETVKRGAKPNPSKKRIY